MEQMPKATSLFEFGEKIFEEAADNPERFKIEPTQWPDGRTVEAVQYQATPIVNVRIMRPGIDTQELMSFEEDSEHSGVIKMELSILCDRRFKIDLENGERYAGTLFYIGIFDEGAFLMSPTIGLINENIPYVNGWNQKPLTKESEWFLQDLIKPQPGNITNGQS